MQSTIISYGALLLFLMGTTGMLLGMQHVDLPLLFGSTAIATLGAFVFGR